MAARSYCCHMTKILPLLLLGASLVACAPSVTSGPIGRGGAPTINTVETAVAPDAVADTLLTDVKALDSSIVVDLRYATANNFTGAPLPGYLANRAFLRREAAAALERVQRDLRPQRLGLKVFDAYRPVRATLAMVDWTLIDLATGKELEMGTPFDTFSAAAHTANAAGEAAVNRQRLKAAMEKEGFVNYDQEWWHFSFDVPNPLRFDRVIR